jgi:hypothetical protein
MKQFKIKGIILFSSETKKPVKKKKIAIDF